MRLSVGIPFYNNARTLADAIRSVFAQTFRDWELILADDGSADDSLEIARAVSDPRVTVVSDGTNRGLSHRLNQITHLARGEYVARMDADDLMHPERLARQVQYLDANPRVDLVCTAAYTLDEAGTPVGVRALVPLDTRPIAVLGRTPLIHATVTGRTGWFRQNPYDESFLRAEDHELWCRTCGKSVIAKLREPLFFLKEEESLTFDKYSRSCEADIRIFRTYGPPTVGRHRVVLLVARTNAKRAIYRVCTALRLQRTLVRRRSAPLNPGEQARALAALNIVLRTSVPGLPSREKLSQDCRWSCT